MATKNATTSKVDTNPLNIHQPPGLHDSDERKAADRLKGLAEKAHDILNGERGEQIDEVRQLAASLVGTSHAFAGERFIAMASAVETGTPRRFLEELLATYVTQWKAGAEMTYQQAPRDLSREEKHARALQAIAESKSREGRFQKGWDDGRPYPSNQYHPNI
jgi:hypothetical protein